MFENAVKAAMLDKELYAKVEHDPAYNTEALWVVVVANALSAAGAWFTFRGGLLGALIGGIIGGIVGWLIWAGLTYWVGTSFFKGTADYGEMLRVLGYAQAPRALGIIPFLGLAALVWTLIASVVAVKEGLDFSLGKAIATVIVGWLAMLVLSVIWAIIF